MSVATMRRRLRKNGLFLKRRGRYYYCNGDYDVTYDIVDADNVIQMENATLSDIEEIILS